MSSSIGPKTSFSIWVSFIRACSHGSRCSRSLKVCTKSTDFLKHFPYFYRLQLEAFYFRKMIHSHGLDWIRSKNADLRVNLSDKMAIFNNRNRIFYINLRFRYGHKMKETFPDEDLCLYKAFPFEQLIYIISKIDNYYV